MQFTFFAERGSATVMGSSRAKLTYHERRADIYELQGVVTLARILASYGIDGKRSLLVPTGRTHK